MIRIICAVAVAAVFAFIAGQLVSPAYPSEPVGKLTRGVIRAQAAQMLCGATLDPQKLGVAVLLAAEESGRNVSSTINLIADQAQAMATAAMLKGKADQFCAEAMDMAAPLMAE